MKIRYTEIYPCGRELDRIKYVVPWLDVAWSPSPPGRKGHKSVGCPTHGWSCKQGGAE